MQMRYHQDIHAVCAQHPMAIGYLMNNDLTHTLWLPLLGLPLTLHTNSQSLAAALEQQRPLGNWADLPADLIDSLPPLQMDVVVGDAGEQRGGMRLHRHGPLTLAGDGSHLLLAQADRGYGLAFVPSDPLTHALTAIWDLGMLLAHGRGRTPIRAAALECNGHAILLVGTDLADLLHACADRGLQPLAKNVVHVSTGAGGLRIWGDGIGENVLSCAGPATLCLVEQGTVRASQIVALHDDVPIPNLNTAVGANYRLSVGTDVEMAAVLIEHVARMDAPDHTRM